MRFTAPSRSNRPYPMIITFVRRYVRRGWARSRFLRGGRAKLRFCYRRTVGLRVTALPIDFVTNKTTGRKTISQRLAATLFPARSINSRRPTTTYWQLAANLKANYKSIITCLTVTKGVILAAVHCWYCHRCLLSLLLLLVLLSLSSLLLPLLPLGNIGLCTTGVVWLLGYNRM